MQTAPSMRIDGDVDDATLIRAYRDGDTAAFDVLFERHYADLVRFLRVRLRDEAAAEDVAQDTMIRAMRAIDRFDCDRPLRPWLRQIARNAGVDLMRSRGRAAAMSSALEQQPQTYATAADTAMGDIAEVDLLRRALGDVPDRQRQALLRCYVEGWRPAEAAADFGVCSNAFDQLLHRARTNLRRAYLRHDGEDRAAGLVWMLLAVAWGAQRRVVQLARASDALPGLGQVMASGIVAASLTVVAGIGQVTPPPVDAPPAPVPHTQGVASPAVPGPPQPAVVVPPVRTPSSQDTVAAPAPDVQRPAPVALEPQPAPDQTGPAPEVRLPTGGQAEPGLLPAPAASTPADSDPDRVPAADPTAADEGVPQAVGGCGSVVRGAVCAVDEQVQQSTLAGA